MKSRVATWVLGLGACLVAAGCGSDDDAPDQGINPLQLEPVEKLFFALGGEQGFEALEGLRITSSGSRYLPHEGSSPDEDPVLANDFERAVSLSFSGDLMRTDVQREVQFLFTGEQSYTEVIRGNIGASTQPFFGMALGNLTSDRVAAIQVQEMLLNPHLLVSNFGANIVYEEDSNIGGVAHHRLAVDSAQPIFLFVDATTGYLSRLDTREHDFYMRDVETRVYYEDWQTTEGGLAYPGTVRLMRGGLDLYQHEVSSFEVNPAFTDETFVFPDGTDPQFDEDLFRRGARSNGWYFLLESIGLPFQNVDTMVNAVPVEEGGSGAWQLQGASHHSFLVEQSAGLVLVDAPLYQDRSEALIAYLDTTFPNKSVTHVVASHFHEDHVAGIREVLGRTEATLVVHESTEEFWRGILAAPSTIYPDSLARRPRQVEIQTVPDDESLTLADSARPVELFDMNAEHASDLLLTRDVTSNSVFVVDIYSPGNGEPFEPQTLDATILENDIPTDTLKIVGGHGNVIHGYADLEGYL